MREINIYSVAGYERTFERVATALREFSPIADPSHHGWLIQLADGIVTVRLTDPAQLNLGLRMAGQIRTKLSRTSVVPKRIRSVVTVAFEEAGSGAAFAEPTVVAPDGSGPVVASRIANKLAEWDTVIVIHDTGTDRLDRITPTRLVNR